MTKAADAIGAAIDEVTRARARVSRAKTRQITKVDDVALLSATATTWFHTHRPDVVGRIPQDDIAAIDGPYNEVLAATSKSAAKKTYLRKLKGAKDALVAARPKALTGEHDDEPGFAGPPDFSPLVGNQDMREILTRRWNECAKCVAAEAHLAAIVMMGGFLEALFVARANKMSDKGPLTKAASAPKDKATGKTLNYQSWMLDSYIKVGAELRWITASAGRLADVLKEYRNYVHPEKERRHGVVLELNDSSVFWQLTQALAEQLLQSARGR